MKLLKQSVKIIKDDQEVVYLKMTGDECISKKYRESPNSVVKLKYSDNPNIFDVPRHYITTTRKIISQNGWEKDLEYRVEKPEKYHCKRLRVKIICDTQVASDLLGENYRFSEIVENGTIGEEVELVIPFWLNEDKLECYTEIFSGEEKMYKNAICLGWPEKIARGFLPMCLKTEITMIGFESQWKELFNKTFNNPQTNELLKLISTKILI